MASGIQSSELILNPDGSLYHLRVRAEHIADTVLVVGDPGRVARISKHFDRLEHQIENREFVTHTGYIGTQRLTVLATGIGTDNIDIVLNELDAAFNIDPVSRKPRTNLRSLNLIRLGTTGSLQADIPVDSLLISAFAAGLDGLLHFYDRTTSAAEQELEKALIKHLDFHDGNAQPYVTQASAELVSLLDDTSTRQGITATASGFYAPQGRQLRLAIRYPDLIDRMGQFSHGSYRLTNLEMETSALYGLGHALGHRCCTICTVLANRATGEFSSDHARSEERLIQHVLHKLTA